MEKIKKIIKNNKYTMIGLIAFALLIVLGFGLYKFLFPNIGSPVYGNRLDGIEKAEITSKEAKEIIGKLSENEVVVKATYDLKGRIFNIIITVKENTNLDTAKKLLTIVTDGLTEDQQKYFDIQVFLKNETDNIEGYPTIGYKSKSENTFYYSSASSASKEE